MKSIRKYMTWLAAAGVVMAVEVPSHAAFTVQGSPVVSKAGVTLTGAGTVSMTAAIQTLASLATTGRKIAILGDMRELGPTSPQCHRDVGRFVAEKCSPDMLICVGTEARLSTAAERPVERGGFAIFRKTTPCKVESGRANGVMIPYSMANSI